MLMPATPELIQVRIIELVAKRNAMAAFTMNSTLMQQATIVDKQILALRTILDMDSVPAITDELFEWPKWDDDCKRTDKGLKL